MADHFHFVVDDVVHLVKSHYAFLSNSQYPQFSHPSYEQAVLELLHDEYAMLSGEIVDLALRKVLLLQTLPLGHSSGIDYKHNNSDDVARMTVLVDACHALARLPNPNLHERGLELAYSLRFRERDWLYDFLIDWANQLVIEKQQFVQNWWLNALERELYYENVANRLEGAMHMIVKIGKRTAGIERQLIHLAGITGSPDKRADVQDQAIGTLAWIGYPNEEDLVKCLEQRLNSADRKLLWLLPPLRLLTPRSLLPNMLEMYKQHRDDSGHYSSLLWVIADFALVHSEEADRIWTAVEEGITLQSTRVVNSAGGVTSQIDSPTVKNFFCVRFSLPLPKVILSNGV